MLKVEYLINEKVSVEDFMYVLQGSGLAERRPVSDISTLQWMLDHANLTISAKIDGVLIGIARSVTDFHYACYLSDLAVLKSFQKKGIGKKLIEETKAQLGPNCSIILLSAPKAGSYYPHIGFKQHDSAWTLAPDMPVCGSGSYFC
jgi:GNAT superfamily N-acetyltransferase